ncbi:MAG: ABC transporter ATP-binding protein/permease [Chromatiales bacterium]|nr:ABC transporter ATP-binding protein/permease [Chromatiales bacterium]
MYSSESTDERTPVWQGKRKRYLASLVVFGFIQAVVIMGVSALVAQVFTSIGDNNTGISWLVVLILLAAVSLAILRWAERVFAEHLGQDYIVQVRLRLFRHLMFADQRSAQRFSHGAMALRFVTDLSGLRQWVALGMARLVVIVSTVISILALLAFRQPVLMLFVIGAVLLAVVLCVVIGSKLSISIRAVRKYRARLAATVTDRINTLTTVQACIQERREIRRVRRQSESLYDANLKRAHITGALFGALEAITVLMTGAILVVAGMLVESGQLSLGDVAASMTLLGLLLTPMRDMGRIMDYWKQWQVSNEKIALFLKVHPRYMQSVKSSEAIAPTSDFGNLIAKGVAIEGLLEPSDFSVPAGHHIVLDGGNGSGKTSLLLTIAGVLPLQTGVLTLDGQTLVSDKGERIPVSGIGLVSPDMGLMRGSLKRNLTYANPKASAEDIHRVIRQCDLVDLIQILPRGLDTRLSEGGKNLSVGERKRIVLARTLLMQPRILLLDELDAHLDIRSLAVIEQALTQFRGSVIEVSHHRKLNLHKPGRCLHLDQLHIHERYDCAEY